MNLILHCGSRHVKREQIEHCTTPPRTDTWVPIPHDHLLEQVESTFPIWPAYGPVR